MHHVRTFLHTEEYPPCDLGIGTRAACTRSTSTRSRWRSWKRRWPRQPAAPSPCSHMRPLGQRPQGPAGVAPSSQDLLCSVHGVGIRKQQSCEDPSPAVGGLRLAAGRLLAAGARAGGAREESVRMAQPLEQPWRLHPPGAPPPQHPAVVLWCVPLPRCPPAPPNTAFFFGFFLLYYASYCTRAVPAWHMPALVKCRSASQTSMLEQQCVAISDSAEVLALAAVGCNKSVYQTPCGWC